MANTSSGRVKSIAKHLKVMSDEDLEVFIDDAYQEVKTLGIKESDEERLTRYLAAHLASLDIRQTQSESVGPMKKTYTIQSIDTNKGLSSTPYGQEYDRLMRKLTGRSSLKLTVI